MVDRNSNLSQVLHSFSYCFVRNSFMFQFELAVVDCQFYRIDGNHDRYYQDDGETEELVATVKVQDRVANSWHHSSECMKCDKLGFGVGIV